MGNLIFLVIIGTAAGFIATRIFDLDIGIPQTIAVGVLGALIGGWLLKMLMMALGIFSGFLGAIIGAIVLIVIYQKFTESRK